MTLSDAIKPWAAAAGLVGLAIGLAVLPETSVQNGVSSPSTAYRAGPSDSTWASVGESNPDDRTISTHGRRWSDD